MNTKRAYQYIPPEGDNGLEQSKTPVKQKNEPDTEPDVKTRLILPVKIPFTPWRDHPLNPLRK